MAPYEQYFPITHVKTYFDSGAEQPTSAQRFSLTWNSFPYLKLVINPANIEAICVNNTVATFYQEEFKVESIASGDSTYHTHALTTNSNIMITVAFPESCHTFCDSNQTSTDLLEKNYFNITTN